MKKIKVTDVYHLDPRKILKIIPTADGRSSIVFMNKGSYRKLCWGIKADELKKKIAEALKDQDGISS